MRRQLHEYLAGDVSSLRAHIARAKYGNHFDVYRKGCSKNGIEVNKVAVPASVKEAGR